MLDVIRNHFFSTFAGKKLSLACSSDAAAAALVPLLRWKCRGDVVRFGKAMRFSEARAFWSYATYSSEPDITASLSGLLVGRFSQQFEKIL